MKIPKDKTWHLCTGNETEWRISYVIKALHDIDLVGLVRQFMEEENIQEHEITHDDFVRWAVKNQHFLIEDYDDVNAFYIQEFPLKYSRVVEHYYKTKDTHPWRRAYDYDD